MRSLLFRVVVGASALLSTTQVGGMRSFVPISSLLVAQVSGESQSQDLPPAVQEAEQDVLERGYSINFNNVGMPGYLRFISQITNTNFIFNPADLDFRVTIVSEQPASIESIMSILLQVLQVHGLAMSEQGNQILIYRPEGVKEGLARLSTVVSDAMAEQGPLFFPLVTRVFYLQYGKATETQTIVQPLLSQHALVQAVPSTNHLVVTDIAGNIEKVAELLDVLDAPPSDQTQRAFYGMEEAETPTPTPAPEVNVAEYQTRFVEPSTLVDLARKILKPLGGHDVELVAQNETDTVFVVATPDLIRRTLRILERLDRPGGAEGAFARSEAKRKERQEGVALPSAKERPVPSTAPRPAKHLAVADETRTQFGFYKLNYQQGDEIQTALQDVASSLKEAGEGDADLIKTISTIQWIRSCNSLVISGTDLAIAKVRKLIQDLDMPLKQVYIEALIVRTTITNSLNIGVEWGSKVSYIEKGANPDVVQGGIGGTKGFPGGNPSPLNARLEPTQIPASIPLQEGLEFGAVGRFVFFNEQLFTSLGSLVNALQVNQDTTILLNPKVLTLDNHQADIFVGSNIAFVESTVTQPGSDTITGEIEYRDIGSTFKVKPTLSNSDVVTIEIDQEISRVTQQGTANNTSGNMGTTEPIAKSSTKTKVAVPDGYFLVISGQISDDKTRRQRGLPCLGGLPLVGVAFSTKEDADLRETLIIFLRPRIVRTKTDMVRLTEGEKKRHDEAARQCSYMMDGERILELLNLQPDNDCCSRCGLSIRCIDPCASPCVCPKEPDCDHSVDPYFDDYFIYPCERLR